jgi:hypothetical protein
MAGRRKWKTGITLRDRRTDNPQPSSRGGLHVGSKVPQKAFGVVSSREKLPTNPANAAENAALEVRRRGAREEIFVPREEKLLCRPGPPTGRSRIPRERRVRARGPQKNETWR